MNGQYESILIGGWLQGEHLDDMQKFTAADFTTYPYLFNAIKKHGHKNIITLCEETSIKPTEMAELISSYQPTLYSSIRSSLYEEKARKYIANSQDKPLEVITSTLSELLSNDFNDVPLPAENVCINYWDELGERKSRKIINTKLEKLDNLLYGVRKKELTSVGARPSVGKSAFMLQVAIAVARQNQTVLYFPLEMTTNQTVERFLLQKVPITYQNLRSGNLDDEEYKKISIASDELDKLEKNKRFLIFEAINDIDVIENLIKTYKPYLVVLDQLEQLVAKKGFKDKRERFSYMTSRLKRMSMTNDVAIWLACQVNRDANNDRPTLANLKESGSIEEDSDNVILLHRIMLDDMGDSIKRIAQWDNNLRPIEINLAKHRSGATGTVNTKYYANRFTFKEV